MGVKISDIVPSRGREVMDLNFLLKTLKEFDKAYLFTKNVRDYVKRRALEFNVEIIDSW